MDKRYKPLTPLEQLHAREALMTTIRAHPEWTFAQAVRHIRKSLRLTVVDMAKVGNLSDQALRNIEAGRNSPTLETASRLLMPFGLRLSVTAQKGEQGG